MGTHPESLSHMIWGSCENHYNLEGICNKQLLYSLLFVVFWTVKTGCLMCNKNL